MVWAQILILVFIGVGFGVSLAMLGKPKKNYDGWDLLVPFINFLIFWAAGAFDRLF